MAPETNYIHINVPRYELVEKRRLTCPVCEKRRVFLILAQAWYGFRKICMGCGDSWHDEGMAERPFMPKWRQKSIESAKRIWKKYGHVDKWADWEKSGCIGPIPE